MGRPKKIDAEIKHDLAQMREQVTAKFFGVSEKVYKHISESLKAERPCNNCTIGPDGANLPGKAKDEAGKCAFCHGTFIIPDNTQRNWAATEALPLITNSKPMEVKVNNSAGLAELEAQMKKLPDHTISSLLRVIGTPEVIDVEPKDTSGEAESPAA